MHGQYKNFQEPDVDSDSEVEELEGPETCEIQQLVKYNNYWMIP